MTKRYGEPISKNTSKKSKVEEELDNFWDDDFDDEVLDRLATQVCEEDLVRDQQKNDVSLLPSYDAFKQPCKVVVSSTQIESSFISKNQLPSTSRHVNVTVEKSDSNQLEITNLKRRCDEKEGEATVLRNQLKELKANLHQEQEKKQNEWNEKFNQKEKQVKALRDQLDFKNLEIANLKQKMVDVVKRVNLDVTLNASQCFSQQSKMDRCNTGAGASTSPNTSNDKRKSNANDNVSYRIHSVSENGLPEAKQNKTRQGTEGINVRNNHSTSTTERHQRQNSDIKSMHFHVPNLGRMYPLRELASSDFLALSSHGEDSCMSDRFHGASDNIPQPNKIRCSEHVIYSKFEQLMNSPKKEQWNIEAVYHSIARLVNCTADEISSDGNREYVNKILSFTLQLINTLEGHLNTLLKKSQTEEIRLLDNLYLTDCAYRNKPIQSDHLTSKVGRCLYILSEVLLCCPYLQDIVLLDKVTQTNVPTICRENPKILHKLLNISSLVGQLRMGHVWTDYQIGVARFLTNIGRTDHFGRVEGDFCKIVKEVIFSRPSLAAMQYVVDLFMIASRYDGFVEFLCKKDSQSKVVLDLKKGKILFNQDSCLFHVFVVLVNNTVLNISYLNQQNLKTCFRLLYFIENVFESNPCWIYHKGSKRCECLDQFYKLSVELIYDVLCKYKENPKKFDYYTSDEVFEFFKCSIKVLSLLSFNSDDLFEKYITVISEYREIIHSLTELGSSLQLSEKHLNDLEKLNISEDTLTIPSNIIKL